MVDLISNPKYKSVQPVSVIWNGLPYLMILKNIKVN